MKKIIVAIGCLLLYFNVFCQDTKLSWGPYLFNPRKSEITAIIGSDKNAIYCLRTFKPFFGRATSLEKYSRSKLKLEYVKEFKLPRIQNKELTFEKIFLLKTSLVVFASGYNKSGKKEVLYRKKIDASTGEVISDFEEIDAFATNKRREESSYNFVLSNDSSQILISHSESQEKAKNAKLSFKLLNQDANLLWSAEVDLVSADKIYTILNCKLDEDGKLFLLANVAGPASGADKGTANTSYCLLSYDHRKKNLKELQIDVNDHLINAVGFELGANKKLVISGLCAHKNNEQLHGAFLMIVDTKSDKVVMQGQDNFPQDFLKEFEWNEGAEKENKLSNYRITGLVLNHNGGLSLLAEQFYEQIETTYHAKMAVSSIKHYYYNAIIVIHIKADASIPWAKKIRKLQHTLNQEINYSSYSYFTSDGNLHFIYNDHPKNIAAKSRRLRESIGRKMTTVITTMHSDGTTESYSIFEAGELKMYLKPKITHVLSPTQFVFYVFRKTKSRFGIINY